MPAEGDGDALPARIRHRFPVFERLVYANSCSQGALSDTVRAAYDAYLTSWEERGSPWDVWVEQAEAARTTFASLINSTPDEVAVTTSVSAGVSALLSSLGFDGGRSTIVVSDLEFPTVGQIAHAQERLGRRVVHVPASSDGTLPPERLAAAIDEHTALVCITAVCYRNGFRPDLEAIVELVHERGALVFVDAYQAAGAIPIDVRALGCDFLAAGTLKYLLGSPGLAFLYCRRDLVQSLVPTQTGWFADKDVFAMDVHNYSPAPTARRFEAGTPPVPSLYAGVAGMRLMQEIGVAETQAHVCGLTRLLIEGVEEELGGRVVTPKDPVRRGPLVAVASTDEHALVRALGAEGIVVSSRDGNLRISLHCYNTRADVEAVLAAIGRHRHLLAR